jgi:hypothetical protein
MPSRHIAATTGLLFGLTHGTASPSVFGIDVDPTCPGRCSAASATRAALPQRASAWRRRKLPGGPDSLRRGLRGRARRVGARMFAHESRHLCHGGRVGRSNRNVGEGEAEGTAPLF